MAAHIRIPGPGLPESLLWTIAILPAQLAGVIVVAVVMSVLFVTAADVDVGQLTGFLRNLDKEHPAALLGGIEWVFLLIAAV